MAAGRPKTWGLRSVPPALGGGVRDTAHRFRRTVGDILTLFGLAKLADIGITTATSRSIDPITGIAVFVTVNVALLAVIAAAEANRAKSDEFLANMSHEIRRPGA